jgi:hypothetical protein
MSSGTPPSPFFSGINFNPLFFQKVISQYLTETIANTKYLMLSGLNYITGNLGIKRAAAVELDVNGQVNINNGLTGLPSYGTYGGQPTRIIFSVGSVSETPIALGVDGSSLWYGSYTGGNHIFYTGIKERLRILSSGNVGIGTSGASSLLHLHIPDTLQEVMLRFSDQSTGGGATDGCAIYKTTSNNLVLNNFENNKILFFTNNTERMQITETGNVGIGTNNPYNSLDVYGSNCKMAIRATHEDQQAVLYYGTSHLSSNVYKTAIIAEGIANNSRANLHFCLNDDANNTASATIANARMTILRGGNVGIGTTNPADILTLYSNEGISGTGNIKARIRVHADRDASLIFERGGSTTWELFQKGSGFGGTAGNLTIQSGSGISLEMTQAGLTTFNNTVIAGGNNINNPSLQVGTNGDFVGVSRPNAGGFSSSAAIGDMVIRSANKLLLQSGSGNCAMCINTNNYVQIGTGYTTATFPITLNSSQFVAQSMTAPYTTAINSGINTQFSGTINPSITVGIMSNTAFSVGFYIYSDKRIKKDFEPIDNSLETIEKINLTSFRYIDWKQKGNIKNYGIIAQEVEEIIPEVINKHQDFIPNIYKNANSYDGISNIFIEIDDISIGDKIKIYDDKNKEHHKEIIYISKDYITIDSPIEDYEEDTPLFIYGKEIPDVKNVTYEALFIINMRATQELYKRVKALEKYFNIVY